MKKTLIKSSVLLAASLSMILALGSCSVDSSDDTALKSDASSNVTPSSPSSPSTPSTTDPVTPSADISNASVEIVKSEGWLNSAYIIFKQLDGATGYKVYVDDKALDEPLIRYYDTYTYYEQSEGSDLQVTWTKNQSLTKVVRADALGLAAGSHTMKVCATNANGDTEYSSSTMTVRDHDRSGFAFISSNTPGAYKADGTLKDNTIVLYVTGDTAKTVSYTAEKGKNSNKSETYTGLQSILSEASLRNLTVPLDIRIVGTIKDSQMDSLASSEEGLQIKTTSENGVTVEGVGHDAGVYGFGFLIRAAKYTELSNIGIYAFMDDGVSIDTDNSYLWVHNCDISYGKAGGDSDQAKGDGSLDFKKSTYSTLSYNHFWDSGKCNLLDASADSSGSNYISYHHNWYDHSDSRHPRIRNASAVHVYNNYYDGNSKYGVGVTSGSSAFVEGNYFRDANDPMMSSKQGTDAKGSGTFSGENGGVIKAWNNFIGDNKYNKLHFVTNKFDYTNNVAVTEPSTRTETLGTNNGDGTWTIYEWKYGDAFPSFISKNDAVDKNDSSNTKPYYQFAKNRTGFTLTVPANASKVILTAKSASSGVTSATLKVGSVSLTVTDDNYPEYIFDVSTVSSTSLAIIAGSEGSINIKSIKVIAPTGWETTYTTGVALNDIDAYEVDSRNTEVPLSVVTKFGNTTYSNFDTKMNIGISAEQVETPQNTKATVMKYSGRHDSDFAWTFDNATEDANYALNSELKAAIIGYTSTLVKVQGASSNNGSGSEGGDEPSTGGDTPVTPETPTVTGVTIVGFAGKDTSSDSSLVSGTWNMKSGSSVTYEGTAYNCAKIESGTAFNVNVPVGTKVTLVTKTTPNKLSVEGTNITAGFEDKSTYFTYTYTTSANPSVIKKGSGSDANLACIVIEPAE